ncbi:MAG: hypothetical protein ACRYFS_08135 [Janthinobacterium lividum]
MLTTDTTMSAAPAASSFPPPALSSLPSGWKHISSQSNKGYKLVTNSHTAYVKPAPSGGYHLLTHETVGQHSGIPDIDTHPSILSTPHEAFALANAKLGRLAPPEPAPAAWDGQGSPAGYTPVGGVSYLHSKTALGKTAFVSKMKAGHSGLPSYTASGYGPGGDLPHQAHTTPQAAHAAAEAYLSSGAPNSSAPSNPLMSKSPIPTAPVQAASVPASPNPADPFHDEAHYGAPSPQPKAAAPPPLPAPAAASKPAPPPAPEPKFVTVPKGGQMVKTPLTEAPITPADMQDAKDTYGLTAKAHTTLQDAVSSGKLKTQGDLAQTLAMTHAINKSSSYAHLTGFSLDKALQHGTVARLKAAAEADPQSEAATHAAALEDTNILSPAKQKAADQDAAFQSLSGDQLMHEKVGAQAGSNPGGFYKTSAGHSVYAKRYADAQQAHSEHAANQIYNALGISAPSSTVAKTASGKAVYASRLIPNTGTLGSQTLTKAKAQEALRGHAADILLGNHDVAGMGLGNLVTGDGGKISRIDNGGALLYRAQGTKKSAAETGSLGAWDGLSDPAKNPDYAKLFQKAGYKNAAAIPGITQHIADIQKLEAKHGGWDKYLQQAAPGMDSATRQQTAAMLTKRTQLLGAKRLEMLESQGGSLDALAGKTSVAGGASKHSTGWGNSPFAQYAKKVDALSSGQDTKDHFGKLYQDHPHVFHDLTSPISSWTGSSSGHAWQDQWPAGLAGKTHAGALKVQEALQTRKDRWQKLSDQHGVPFPETFHVHRARRTRTERSCPTSSPPGAMRASRICT